MAETTLALHTDLAAPERKPRSLKLLRWWRRNTTIPVNISLLLLILLSAAILFADALTPYAPGKQDVLNRLAPPVLLDAEGTWAHPLGTDQTGRDMLSLTLHGGRTSLQIGAISALLGLLAGATVGLLAGYLRGPIDALVMYLVDVQLSLPFLLLAVAVALVLGSSTSVLVFLAALATWPLYARVVRGVVLALREREFVTAARAAGASDLHIMRVHLVPHLVAPTLVIATLSIGRIILLESGLSYLSIGPPNISWGQLINDGRSYLSSQWWLSMVPGLALMTLTIAIGVIGDWLRDLMDVALN